MEQSTATTQIGAFDVLRRFAPKRIANERCDMCSLPLTPAHQHLIEPRTRQLVCACAACAILFSNEAGTRYRTIPREAKRLPSFQLSNGQWETLNIPIGLAFFFYSSTVGSPTVSEEPLVTPDVADTRAFEPHGVVALYPSPAGATESLLDLSAWNEIVQANSILCDMKPDVEALLANRIGDAREYYLAPIDECFRLVGLIRANWRGLSGGDEVWKSIAEFFNQLRTKCEVV